jgi:hypothetical protein
MTHRQQGRRASRVPGQRDSGYQPLCLACSGRIASGQDHIRVENTRGAEKGTIRYMHADQADCNAELRHTGMSAYAQLLENQRWDDEFDHVVNYARGDSDDGTIYGQSQAYY